MQAELLNEDTLHNIRKREQLEDKFKKQRLKRKQFLREQILKFDRIDLLMTEVLDYQVKDFHLVMWYHRRNKARKLDNQKWHLALAPRGTGKSTILTIASIVLDILKNPNIRILISSKTDENAVAFLSEVKQKLLSKKVEDIFGPQKGTLWNEGEIKVGPRTASWKEPTVKTVGVNGALASAHFDKVYADDLVDEENSKTEGQRQKILTWFYKILDPCLEPHGEMSLIGTRYHPNDLYGYLINTLFERKVRRKKDKKVVLRKHHIRVPALMPKRAFPANAKPVDRYVSIWPEKFSVKFLLEKKRSQGTIIFNSQMQNDVEAMKGKIFKYDWFQFYKREDININDLKVFQGVDLAIKQTETADKFAHCTIGVDPKTGNIYVLDYYNRVTHYNNQKRVLKDQFGKYDPIRVGIEANGYQRSLIQDMRTDDKLSNIRAVPVFTETDKTIRAWKLSAYFERGQVFMQEWMTDLQEILLGMPDCRYKDLFDALDFAVNTAYFGKRKVRNSEPGLI